MLPKLFAIPERFYTKDKARLSVVAYAFLALICFGFFTPGIVTLPPTDRDEASFAQASKQMIESGNYVDIRLQNKPRYNKPIGIYWLQSASARFLSSENLNEIFAYRIPSFLGATVAVLMTAALGATLFNPLTGLLASLMLAGCLLLNVEARLAKTDAALLACIVTALYAMARAYKEKTENLKSSRFFLPFVFWTAFAAGVLIKGPIILLPVLGVLLWMKLFAKDISWFRALRPLPGFLYALVLIAPWFIAIVLQSNGLFLEKSAGHDMLAKIWQGQNRGVIPPGMHLTAFPVLFFPFSLFALFAIPDIWKSRKEAVVRFCLGWIIPMWFVFELSFTKLPHYVLPAYPAIALLTARSLALGFPALTAKCRKIPVALITGCWILIGVALAFLPPLLFFRIDGALSLPLVAGGLVLILSQHAGLFLFIKDKVASLIILSIGIMIFTSVLFGHALVRLPLLSNRIVETAKTIPMPGCEKPQLVSVGYAEPSLVFLAGTNTLLLNNGSNAAEVLKQNHCHIAAIDNAHKQAFIDAFSGDPAKPVEALSVQGFNLGNGSIKTMTFYTMPKDIK